MRSFTGDLALSPVNLESPRSGYAETRYKAKAWKAERHVCARIEATQLGLDIRTSLAHGSGEHM